MMVMLKMMNRPFLYASDFDQMSISCCRFNQMIVLKISSYFYKYSEVITSNQTSDNHVLSSSRLNLEISCHYRWNQHFNYIRYIE